MKMKTLRHLRLLTLTAALLLSLTPMDGGMEATEADTTVWICGGPKSKRYHSTKNCPGLNRCSKTPRAVSLSNARASGYTPCRKCY